MEEKVKISTYFDWNKYFVQVFSCLSCTDRTPLVAGLVIGCQLQTLMSSLWHSNGFGVEKSFLRFKFKYHFWAFTRQVGENFEELSKILWSSDFFAL